MTLRIDLPEGVTRVTIEFDQQVRKQQPRSASFSLPFNSPRPSEDFAKKLSARKVTTSTQTDPEVANLALSNISSSNPSPCPSERGRAPPPTPQESPLIHSPSMDDINGIFLMGLNSPT